MAELLLDQIRSQIRERVRELEPVAREYARLDGALTALGGPVEERASAAAPKPSAAVKRRAQRPTSGRQPRAKRAPRGANRAAVVGALSERPGASANEPSAACGVVRPVLYALLKRLEESGEVVTERLPGGKAGYRLAAAS